MTSKLTTETGYINLVIGLLDILTEVNGVEVAGDIIYMKFHQQGEYVGNKLETARDPQTAIKEFFEYIRPYYDIEINNEKPMKEEYTSIQIKNCLIQKLCRDRGLSIKNPLCRSTQGFIEGALSSITGKQVNLDISHVNCDICQGIVEIKKKHDIFDFI